MIEKTYQPAQVEGRIYKKWEEAGAFRAGRPERAQAKPYSIVIPPPNVTGSLHMGHALNNTLQDILCRFERMRGRDVLWQPGTDHAGIATQMVVERQLAERGEPNRRQMGREKFLERVWAWKEESGGTIVTQLRRLGASCDWSRERFTMDEGLSRAVIKVFVELYREGLIYKDKRLVNWDPKLLTAISDLEVVQVETKGHLWHLRYPIEGKRFNPDDASTFIVVATTRPETMLGDAAVAVHPNDERYKDYVDAFKAGNPVNVVLPLVGRRIPIIADEYSDPEKGSGAVKITPAHDFNDFEVGKRHKLRMINVFSIDGTLRLSDNQEFVAHVGEPGDKSEENFMDRTIDGLDGVDRSIARKKIIEWLKEESLIEKIEPHTHMVPHGDRSNVAIEPFLTEQWYVKAKKLAEPAIAAVRAGKINFVPKNWEKTFFDWMENIQPWCISRQLWWGHQIPVWYGRKGDKKSGYQSIEDDPEIFVAASEAETIKMAQEKYGCAIRIVSRPRGDLDPIFDQIVNDEINGKPRWEPIWRDEDVLDTWFSSALWPFSTLGWPDRTKELERFYPTSVLVTGFDIIFFWVARMIMMALHFMKKDRSDASIEQIVPFRDVYIHALVRDATGAKMSKSKGNVIDPLALIDEYGADALRFTLAAMAAQGRDIKLSTQRVEGYRNFATKLWNATRFGEMNGCITVAGFDPKSAKETINRWIAHETAKAAAEITEALESYKFNEAAGVAYRFVWNIYCDWYLELAKPVLLGEDGAAKAETRAMVAWARDEILKLLHPFMPFITEELWAVTGLKEQKGGERGQLLALSDWPAPDGLADAAAEAEIGWLIDLVTAIRSLRAEMNVTASMPLILVGTQTQTQARAQRWAEFIKRLARISEISSSTAAPAGSVQLIVRGDLIALPLVGIIDLAAERARLVKEVAKAEADIARIDAKLGNASFLARAPEEVIEDEKEKRDDALERKAKITEALERLKSAQ